MKAVVVHGAGDLRVDERSDPVPGAGEVLDAVAWSGVPIEKAADAPAVAADRTSGSSTATPRPGGGR